MSQPALDLRVHLEPIIRLADEQAVARELLLRPVGGGDLTERAATAAVDMAWVTGYALQCAGAVLEFSTLPLHVNITPGDLVRPSFVDQVSRFLTPAGLSMLIFEVTEQTELIRCAQLDDTLLALRRSGARFAIDDYGDGWADMASVEAVKPEVIKVRLPRLRQEPNEAEAVAALLDAANRIHARVVVEQIETRRDLDEVRAYGFTHAQGWFWDAPPRG